MKLETNVVHPPSSLRLAVPNTTGKLLEVEADEKITFLQEGYGLGPGGTADHRYQVIFIPVLGTHISTFWTDLGPATDFYMEVDEERYLAPPYHHLVLSEHTVAECRFYAERDRMDDFAVQLLHTQVNESTLFADFARLIEEDMRLVRNRSSFGPHAMVQRNGYSQAGAAEHARLTAERTAVHG